ncbi:MAG TPA: 50S ribosomal protein L21 [Balneolales bacterium]|nr:50S ribosomal protein L21 [Balneolales bacterium]
MYAIIEIGGHQYKVAENDIVYVDRQDKSVDDKIKIDRILLVSDDKGKVNVGTPVVDGAKVEATVLDHVKAEKVIVFKKKRRKGYKVRNGHRQQLTQIRIDKVSAK